MNFTRYAIYVVPALEAEWVRFCTAWLGWDVATGQTVPHPDFHGIDVATTTEVPRKYGLHATMKPPFRLREGQSLEALQDACAQLAQTLSPVTLAGLRIAPLGRFLALVPDGDTDAVDALATSCVCDLDNFRAPLSEPELTRRRSARLTPTQENNVTRWGYPHVIDAFRFHITLTGKLNKPILREIDNLLKTRLRPLLATPFEICDLTLVGEAEDGRFHLLHRYPLGG